MAYTYNILSVDRIVDGDTVDLTVDCGFYIHFSHRFRLWNVDTPETYRVSKDSEEYARGMEATEFTTKWFEDRHDKGLIAVTYKADSFGRWLADIYDEDMNCLNLALKDRGW